MNDGVITWLMFNLVLGGGSLYALWFAVKAWRDSRAIEDTPTSRVRSAAQGYVELDGRGTLPPGVVPLGSVPEPINRDFSVYNTNDHAVDITLDLECISIETSPPLGETLNIVNTAQVATTTFDPDHGNDQDSATITVSKAAGLPVSHVARPRFGTVSIASTGSTATVPVSCSGNTTCSGTVTLTASVSSSTRSASAAKLRKVVLGKAKYSVKPGKTVKVAVKVSSKYRKTVASGRVKKVGITSQREIEKAVRDAIAAGKLKGNEKLPAKMVLTIGGVSLTHEIAGEIELG